MKVITAYFNPCGYKSKLRNYKEFRNCMEKAGASLLTMEMSEDIEKFQIEDSVKILGNCLFWPKESLITKGMEIVDEEIFAWVDCDIIFEDPDWIRKTIKALEHNDVVQMFKDVNMMDPDGAQDKKFKSMIHEFYNNKDFRDGYPNQGHPGFAFAARKDKVKFYTNNFMFSNDVIFCSSLTHDYWIVKSWGISKEIKEDIIKWCESTNVKFSFVDMNIRHLWHGSWPNRQYNSRMELVNRYGNRVKIKDGFYQCDDQEALEEFKKFFLGRKEDLFLL